jgi:redox-sensitive bicupin YhaK (pirin superfamily)
MTNRLLITPGNWADYDPFLVLVEDWLHAPGGFPDHPHRGIDDVQWMTAGKGIIHAELPHADRTSHTLQLWLNLPAARKMVDSAYQDVLADKAVRLEDAAASLRLISGSVDGVAAPVRTQTPVQYLDVRVAAGATLGLPIPAAHNGFVLVLEGEPNIGPEPVAARAGQVLWLDYPAAPRGDTRLDTLRIAAERPARVLVVTGEPLGERVVAYGPFVMNTEDEIRQAYADFHSGKFGGPTPAAQLTRP